MVWNSSGKDSSLCLVLDFIVAYERPKILLFLHSNSDIVANEEEWRPVIRMTKKRNFPHLFQGLLQTFTRTLSTLQVSVECVHEIQSSYIVNGPQCRPATPSGLLQQGKLELNPHSFCSDFTTPAVIAAKDNQLCVDSTGIAFLHCKQVVILFRDLFIVAWPWG